jgi:hypothetical protein
LVSAQAFSRSPGGSLTAANPSTVTLAPVPFGVNGTDTNHYVYISGGTGTAEAVLITGGTAVSGAATGTITFTPANNHTGAWTVSSASGGLAESLVLLAGNGTILMDITAPCTLHQKVTFPAALITLQGGSTFNPCIIRGADYVNGDLLYVGPTASLELQSVRIENGAISTQTSGAALHYQRGNGRFTNVSVFNGYIGALLEGVSIFESVNYFFYSADAWTFSGLHVKGDSAIPSADLIFLGGHIYLTGGTPTGASGSGNVRLSGVDSFKMIGTTLGFGNYQININPDTGYNVLNVFFGDIEGDTANINGIALNSLNGGVVSNVTFNNCKFLGEGGVNTTYGFDWAFSAVPTGTINTIQVLNCTFQGWGDFGIAIAVSSPSSQINNCLISNNNTNNTAAHGGLWCFGAAGINISGNVMQGTNPTGGHQYYGLVISSTCDNLVVTGNNLSGITAPVQFNSIPANFVLSGNIGIDNIIPAVASAAALSFPPNPFFTITGTTGVTSVNSMWAGESGMFVTTTGAVTFTAGATIGNTFTTTQNVPVNFFFDGTKVWLH